MDFYQMTVTYEYPRPSVTVDTVIFAWDDGRDEYVVLLIQRGKLDSPFYKHWALPGGFLNENEDLEVGARRELKEETGVEVQTLWQFGAYGTPGRDPRGHVISVAYWTQVDKTTVNPVAADDAMKARWWPVKRLPTSMAFDHAKIIEDALVEYDNWSATA